MSKNKKLVLGILFAGFAVCLFIGLFLGVHKINAFVFTETNYQEYYDYGEKIDILKKKIINGGTEYDTEAFIITPSGNKIQSSKLLLDEIGKYSIEYKAEIEGKFYKEVVSFTVRQRLYNFENARYDTEKDALRVVFDNSNTELKFNKPINLKGVTDETLLCSVDVHTLDKTHVSVQNLFVKFTDVYNADNYMMLVLHMTDAAASGEVYLQAGGAGQALKGAYKGQYGSKIYSGGTYGTACHGVIHGNNLLRSADFYYDDEDKTITTSNGIWSGLICDMDDPSFYSSVWEGFTTGDVYVSVSVSVIAAESCTVDILNIYGLDLKYNEYSQSFAEPNIEIEYGGYSVDTLPVAKQGNNYKVFNAVGYNGQYSEKITPTVYFGYGDTSEAEIEVDADGYFKTDYCGTYSMVYRVKLPNGKYYEKQCRISCIENMDDISVNFATDLPDSFDVGEKYVFPDLVILNASGDYKTEFDIKLNGEKISYEKNADGKYIVFPKVSGNLTVSVKVKDFIGREAVLNNKVIEINDVTTEKFIEEPVLPKYVFNGYEFDIPAIKAYNYSTQQYADVEIYTEDINGETKNTTGSFIPQVNNSLEKIKIKYKTQNAEKVYQIPVIKFGVQGNLNMQELFVADAAISKTSDENKISFTTNADSSFEFANKLLAETFSFAFNVNSDKNNFNRVNVYLTDSEDDTVKIKLTFERSGNNSKLYINDGGSAYSLNASFTGKSTSNFSLSYLNSKTLLQIDGKDILVVNDLNGNNFEGFTSQYLYVLFEFEGVAGSSCIEMFEIGKQVLSSKENEFIKPTMYIDGYYGGFYQKGEEYDLAKLFAGDALSTKVDIKYSFTCPNRQKAVSTNGVIINNLNGCETYKVILDQEGKYSFVATVTDQNGNVYKKNYTVTVKDGVAPVIQTPFGSEATIKIDDTIDLSSISVSDNSGKVNYNVYLFTSDGNMRAIKAEPYKFTEAGEYTLCIYAYDETYNVNSVSIKINVVKEK